MIRRCKSSGADILLVGMKIPPNYGPAYTNGFYDTYQFLAKKYGIPLVPFLLDGIATKRNLMQEDNMHPTAEAQPLILENVWAQLEPLLTKIAKRSPG